MIRGDPGDLGDLGDLGDFPTDSIDSVMFAVFYIPIYVSATYLPCTLIITLLLEFRK